MSNQRKKISSKYNMINIEKKKEIIILWEAYVCKSVDSYVMMMT